MNDLNYIETKVQPILEPMMIQLLIDKPDQIVDAMLDWLEILRDNGADYKLEQQNQMISTKIDENRNYITTRIHSIFEKMGMDLLQVQPEEPVLYMIDWLKEKGKMVIQGYDIPILPEVVMTLSKSVVRKNNYNEEQPSSEEEDEHEEEYAEEVSLQTLQHMGKKGMRNSVCAEVYGKYNVKQNYKPRNVPKSQEQLDRIYKKLQNSFMFSGLDEGQKQIILTAMEEKKFKAGDWVIKQGEDGNVLYLVDSGQLDCYKKFQKNEEPTYLKTYQPGDSFGELALLYNSQRQASIRAKTEAVLWELDRDTFNLIVKEYSIKSREYYCKFLIGVDLISDLLDHERSQLCDCLQYLYFKKGDYVVKQGDQGDKFFMIEQGELVALKVMQPGGQPEEVKNYKEGEYFGEKSFIKNQPRAASILCKTACKLVAIDRYTFKRLLGPVEDILKRNMAKFTKYISQSEEN